MRHLTAIFCLIAALSLIPHISHYSPFQGCFMAYMGVSALLLKNSLQGI